jgi:hypothetical protein
VVSAPNCAPQSAVFLFAENRQRGRRARDDLRCSAAATSNSPLPTPTTLKPIGHFSMFASAELIPVDPKLVSQFLPHVAHWLRAAR